MVITNQNSSGLNCRRIYGERRKAARPFPRIFRKSSDAFEREFQDDTAFYSVKGESKKILPFRKSSDISEYFYGFPSSWSPRFFRWAFTLCSIVLTRLFICLGKRGDFPCLMSAFSTARAIFAPDCSFVFFHADMMPFVGFVDVFHIQLLTRPRRLGFGFRLLRPLHARLRRVSCWLQF